MAEVPDRVRYDDRFTLSRTPRHPGPDPGPRKRTATISVFFIKLVFDLFYKRPSQKSCLQKQVLCTRFSNGGCPAWVQIAGCRTELLAHCLDRTSSQSPRHPDHEVAAKQIYFRIPEESSHYIGFLYKTIIRPFL